MRGWAKAADDATKRRERAERLAIAFGLDGSPWNEELILQRYELIYEAGLVEEAVRIGVRNKPVLIPGRPMVADHRRILATGIARLRAKIKYRPVVFELMPPTFTLLQLQRAVEALAGRLVHKPNFRRLIEQQDLVEDTGQTASDTPGRPAKLYRFRRAVLAERAVAGTKLPLATRILTGLNISASVYAIYTHKEYNYDVHPSAQLRAPRRSMIAFATSSHRSNGRHSSMTSTPFSILKRRRNAIILAHNYQTPEIFHCVADIVGDSLALAREAAKVEAEIIVLAGVNFMAETAKLLNPNKTVLIRTSRPAARWPNSIKPADVGLLRESYPGVPIVAYVNTSAAVKAQADICCTSGNARAVVESLGTDRVIMLPDEYLANNVAAETDVKIIAWKGHCEVHERFTPAEIAELREPIPASSCWPTRNVRPKSSPRRIFPVRRPRCLITWSRAGRRASCCSRNAQ